MQLIRNTLTVPGLTRPIRLFHITDSHITLAAEEDTPYIKQLSEERTGVFKPGDGKTTVEILQEMLDKSRELASDCVILTGDIIDYPSIANLRLLHEVTAGLPSFFYTVGNHDWVCPKDYPPDEKVLQLNQTLVSESTGTPADFWTREISGLLLIGLDNSYYQITEEQLARTKEALKSGLPSVLCCHVPLYSETLVADTEKRWNAPIIMGSPDEVTHGKSYGTNVLPPDASTRAFMDLIRSAENLKAVITGHLHFSHEDQITPDLPQFVTGGGPMNTARVLDLIPE